MDAASIHDRVHSIPPQNQGPGSPGYAIEVQWRRHGIVGCRAFYDRNVIWMTGHVASWRLKEKALQVARATVGPTYVIRDCITLGFSFKTSLPSTARKAMGVSAFTLSHSAQEDKKDRLLEWQVARIVYRVCGASAWKQCGIHVKKGHLTLTFPTRYSLYWPRIRHLLHRFPIRSIHYGPYLLKS